MFTRDVAVASVCFVLSGAAALIYQVAWQRLLTLTTGVSMPSVAAITAAFMAGLGIGSHLGGVWSSRLSTRDAVRRFALVELGVAGFALLSVPLYYQLLYRRMPWLYEGGTVLTFFVHLLSLIVPTTLMGMSLPLLARGLVLSRQAAARTIGLLYAMNALGAAAGAYATPWLLMRFLGVDGAVWFGAGLSAAAGVGALLLSRKPETDQGAEGGASDASVPSPEPAQPMGIWVALYALSGFVSLSLEIVWFRVLDVMAKGGAFTFGTLLGIYLLGLALGSFAGTLLIERIRRPLRAFLMCQALVLVTTLAAHALFVTLPASTPGLRWIIEYGGSPTGSFNMESITASEFLLMYVAMPLALFGPATFLMGFGFPILQRAVQGDPATSGRRVGILQAANIAGCTLGSLVSGLLLLDVLGTARVFVTLGVIGVASLMVLMVRLRDRLFLPFATALIALVVLFPAPNSLWLRLHGDALAADSYFEEDAASVTGFTPRKPRGYTMWVGGRSISWVPFGSIHTVLGAAPALVHPSPQDVAIIGLGSGDTAWAVAMRPETKNVTIFEIATSQPRLLERVRTKPGMEKLDAFLRDPRFRVVKDDGRRRLGTDGIKYDVIEADALFPDSGLSGNLYSVEFFELASRALKPGGIMCTWVPRARVGTSAQRAFRYWVQMDRLLVLSNDPIPIEPEVWKSRLHSEAVRAYIGEAQLGPIERALMSARVPDPVNPGHEFNEDLQPRDEFVRPRKR